MILIVKGKNVMIGPITNEMFCENIKHTLIVGYQCTGKLTKIIKIIYI